MKKKTVALLLALVMVFGAAVGGTIAWLTDKTAEVKNTFTVGKVDIDLTETNNTDTDGDKEADAWTAQLIPGTTYAKDPIVTVKADSEDCYLFVKFEEKNSPAEYLTYTSTLTEENGWALVEGETNVWYKVVDKAATDTQFHLLAGDTITVKDSVTNANMNDAAKAELVYTAYACQSANMAVTAAWAEVSK